jgi:hypothetical protein
MHSASSGRVLSEVFVVLGLAESDGNLFLGKPLPLNGIPLSMDGFRMLEKIALRMDPLGREVDQTKPLQN